MGKSNFIPVTLMEKYEKMISDLFRPMEGEIESRLEQERKAVKVEIMREWGLTDMIINKAKLEVQLKLLTDEINGYTESNRYPRYQESKLAKEIARRLDKTDIGMLVRNARDTLIEQIRLSAMPEEIRVVFDEAKKIAEAVAQKVAALPPPKNGLDKLDPAIKEFVGVAQE